MTNSLERLANTYSGKTVLITGHTGFKGSWLSVWLGQLGARVIGVSNGVPTKPAIFDELVSSEEIETNWLDICDTSEIAKLINQTKPEFIFHLAAQPIVSTSFKEPLETWRVNSLGMVSLLDAVRISGIESCYLILITSDKVYKNVEWVWGYRENDQLGGIDPYSASKAAAELAFKSYFGAELFANRNIAGVTVRAGNVIGGGDWADSRIVPDAIRAWLESSPLPIRNLSSTRPWQHVLEPLGGYLLSGQMLQAGTLKNGESLNFGPDEYASRTVGDLVDQLATNLGPDGLSIVIGQNEDMMESSLLRLSSEKARAAIGWFPLLDFTKTIEWTAEWYFEKSTGASALSLVKKDINRYQNLITLTSDWGVS